ncbi:hypothetical protein HDU91_006537 [Kappamyces sp. JEL0680]|nr:hypothetical protein HDU91_006537 [Kappamyces sp. JEL0680]
MSQFAASKFIQKNPDDGELGLAPSDHLESEEFADDYRKDAKPQLGQILVSKLKSIPVGYPEFRLVLLTFSMFFSLFLLSILDENVPGSSLHTR